MQLFINFQAFIELYIIMHVNTIMIILIIKIFYWEAKKKNAQY